MALSTERKYVVNGEPVNAEELIDEAAAIDQRFANDWLKQTSVAADILRKAGRTVERIIVK